MRGQNMGIGERKRDVRERIIAYRYRVDHEDIWELLDIYDNYLESEHTENELAEAAFLRGDVAFHMGRYGDTVKALTKCLAIEKTPDYAYLEADAYNMLGMLFSFIGYESIALDNYMAAIESARRSHDVPEEVTSLLNIGILYQGLGDYRKAMHYYKRGYHVANNKYGTPEMMLVLFCLIQEAQLLVLMNRYDDAKHVKREIDSYYKVIAHDDVLLPKCILEVWLESNSGSQLRIQELIEEIRQCLMRDVDYLEQIDVYVDFCAFLMKAGRKADARQFLDLLTEKLGATELLHLRMRLAEMEVQYHKRYSSQAHYFGACMHYMALQQEYERALLEFKRANLNNIESLQTLEEQRQEFEFKSKRDLATGLLNKETFRFETERYLSDRNRGVTDAMIVIDIDNFKLVNDRFGHLVGDEVLTRFSELFQESFDGEICGRFGGDEFVVFIRDTQNMEQVEKRAEQFREAFSQICFGKNGSVHSTVSMGISYNSGMNASYTTMLSCADEALLKAKEYGKNRVALYEIKRGLVKYV